MNMVVLMLEKIKELLEIAKENNKKLNILPRTLGCSEDGSILLDPEKKFDRKWFEDDESFSF
jgi:hypothetical protein